MKAWTVLLVVLTSGAAVAQTNPPSPPASTAGTAGVKQHLQSLHYKGVRDLRRGPDPQLHGER